MRSKTEFKTLLEALKISRLFSVGHPPSLTLQSTSDC
jgi:hypothetical protein